MMEDESDDCKSSHDGSKKPEVLKLLGYEYYLSGDIDEAYRHPAYQS